MRIGLVGRHQIENGRVAIATIGSVRERFGITDDAIRRGLADVRRNSGIRGRFETVMTSPRLLLDVAHNPDGARVLVETLGAMPEMAGGRARFVFGAVQDKDVAEVTKVLAPTAERLYAVRADSHRSLPADEIAYHAEEAGIATTLAGSVGEGVEAALAEAAADDTIVICGSFYVVADAIVHLDARGVAREEKGSGREPESYDLRVAEKRAMEEADAGATGIEEMEIALDGEPDEEDEPRRAMREWSLDDQPRERLMRFGAKVLSNTELIAILLRTGKQGTDVMEMSRQILKRFHSLTDISERDYRELEMIPGVGPAKAVTLAAAFEIGNRLKVEPFGRRPLITGPEDIARIFIPRLRKIQKEQFHVILLNTANRVIRTAMVSEGNLNSSIVHPREVFRTAIVESAASIIGLHNHPSGNPTPSREDIAITRQLVESGRILNIPFHDHIIIAGEEYVSMAEKGYI
jgi:DNA repair protein RadC